MIVAGAHPPISIDFGNDEPGITLQYREGGNLVWCDVVKDGQAVKSPVNLMADINPQFFSRVQVVKAIDL